MLKKSIFTGLFIFASVLFCFAQTKGLKENSLSKIDQIKTVADIEKLLESIDKERFGTFKVNESLEFEEPECRELSKTTSAKAWTKADFDDNGATDLLVHGADDDPRIIVVMDKGNNNFKFENLTRRSFQKCAVATVEARGNGTIVNYKSLDKAEKDKKLVYKFGAFVELNETPKNYKIEKIEYKTGVCFGTCPSFELIIGADRTARYNALEYNKRKGKFSGAIEKDKFDELINLLNYTNFPSLENEYSVNWTDDQTSILTVTYDGGKVKKIRDYGLLGTFGLSALYKALFDLRENQTWK